MTDSPNRHDFAVELAHWGRLPLVLLESHGNDGTGHCEVCPAGGDGAGRLTYPCNVRSAAVEALVIQARMKKGKDSTGQGVIWLTRGEGPERPERGRAGSG
jgi:hypothetical protein